MARPQLIREMAAPAIHRQLARDSVNIPGVKSQSRKGVRDMPTGTCKLCRVHGNLRESHFMPAAVFLQLRTPSRKNPHPVLITKKVSTTSSRQVKDHVLCNDCEQRFNSFGESWVLANMSRPTGFALQDALKRTGPFAEGEGFALFSGVSIPEIDTDSLAYFALSVFWRAAIHQWKSIDGNMEPLDLGTFEEEIRSFLLGGPFPMNAVVTVSVWPTSRVLPAAYTPREGEALGFRMFNFMIPGIEFRLYIGSFPLELRSLCVKTSPQRVIIASASLEQETMQTFFGLIKTSKPSRGLSGK